MTALNQLCCTRSHVDAADPASVLKKKKKSVENQAIGETGEAVRSQEILQGVSGEMRDLSFCSMEW